MNAITQHRPVGAAGRWFWAGWTARFDGPQRILPDVSVSIAWSDDGRVRLYGPHTRAWWAQVPSGREVAWVAVRPGRLGLLHDVRDVLDAELDLDAVLPAPAYAQLVDAVGGEATAAGRLDALQREVCRIDGVGQRPDPAIDAVMSTLRERPDASASELAATVNLTARQLHRRCTQVLGVGPARLRRLLRLERFLRLSCGAVRRPGLAELAAGAGYADQQHLSHECRDLTGRTPSELASCA